MSMEHIDILITRASEINAISDQNFPMKGSSMRSDHILRGGAIAIKDGLIIDVGQTIDLQGRYSAEEEISAQGCLVTPGLVDPHTHLAFAGTRENELLMKLEGKTYMEILAAGGGIQRTVGATRQASEDELVETTKETLDIMLLHGTTTVEGKSGYGLDTETEMKCLRAINRANQEHIIDIIPTFLGAHVIPSEWKKDPEGYVDLVVDEMLPIVQKNQLATYCDVFCEEGVFTVDQSRRILQAAQELGLGLRIHADEIVWTGGAELAGELGAASADHLLRTSGEGMKVLAENEVVPILLPGTPFSLMTSEYAPARMMIDMYELPVALATDFNPNCYCCSMQTIQELACYHMGMTPNEILVASTINPTSSLGLDSEIGTITRGKKADLVIWNAPNTLSLPYRFGINKVHTVIKNGQICVQNQTIVSSKSS